MGHLVSVIMPCYNSEGSIRRAINSIIAQTYTNWELLITDDNSRDNSISVIQEFLKDDRIKLYKLSVNRGAGIARNLSIKNAKGRFIAFCDADDYWFENKLEVHIEFMLANSVGLSYTDYLIYSGFNKVEKRVHCLPRVSYCDLRRTNYIGCLTAIYDTNIVGKNYMHSVRKRQDWILWLEILQKTDCAKGLNIPLAVYNNSNQSLSSNKPSLIRDTWYVYRYYLKYNYVYSLYCMIIFFKSYFEKSRKIKPL